MHGSRRWYVVLTVVIAAVGLWFAWGRYREARKPDRVKVRELLANAEKAIESKNLGRCMSFVSRNYSDSLGYDYREIRRLCAGGFQSVRHIQLTLSDVSIALATGAAPTRAEVTFTVDLALIGDAQRPEQSSGRIHLTLNKERGRWKIVRAEGWSGLEEEVL